MDLQKHSALIVLFQRS